MESIARSVDPLIVSIRAPVKGATPSAPVGGWTVIVSIRAPVKGATPGLSS
jgi:hypothetical protein